MRDKRYDELAREAEPHLCVQDPDWIEKTDGWYPSARSAWQTFDPVLRINIAAALRRYLFARGLYMEARELVEYALTAAPEGTRERAKALAGLASFCNVLGDFERARCACAESLAISGDLMPDVAAEAHNALGAIEHHQGDLEAAWRCFAVSLATLKFADISAEWLAVNVNNNRSAILNERKDYEQAETLCIANAQRAADIGYSHGLATAKTNQTVSLMYQKMWKRALLICRQTINIQRQGSRPYAHSLVNLGIIQTELDLFSDAALSFIEAIEVLAKFDLRATGIVIGEIGALLCRSERFAEAVHLWVASDLIRTKAYTPAPGNEKERIDEYVDNARNALGDMGYEDEYYAGQQLKKSETIPLAIRLCQGLRPVTGTG